MIKNTINIFKLFNEEFDIYIYGLLYLIIILYVWIKNKYFISVRLLLDYIKYYFIIIL